MRSADAFDACVVAARYLDPPNQNGKGWRLGGNVWGQGVGSG